MERGWDRSLFVNMIMWNIKKLSSYIKLMEYPFALALIDQRWPESQYQMPHEKELAWYGTLWQESNSTGHRTRQG